MAHEFVDLFLCELHLILEHKIMSHLCCPLKPIMTLQIKVLIIR